MTISYKKGENKYCYFGDFKGEKYENKINRVIKIILLKKDLVAQSKDTEVLNKEICEDFKYVDGENI